MGNIARAREAAQKPIAGTLQIFLNTEVSRERSNVLREMEDETARAAERIAGGGKNVTTAKITKLQKQLDEIEERERQHAHLLYFQKLPGLTYAELTDQHPPRPDNVTDLDFGYNVRATTLAAAKMNGVEIFEDENGSITMDNLPGKRFRSEPVDEDDWATIEEIASGWDLANLENLILNLNVYYASTMVGRLKKG